MASRPLAEEEVRSKLIEAGEKERLKALLKERLLECGWRDAVKDECRKIVRQRGYENLTVDQLAKEVTPLGRAMVPDGVKAELLQAIRQVLRS